MAVSCHTNILTQKYEIKQMITQYKTKQNFMSSPSDNGTSSVIQSNTGWCEFITTTHEWSHHNSVFLMSSSRKTSSRSISSSTGSCNVHNYITIYSTSNELTSVHFSLSYSRNSCCQLIHDWLSNLSYLQCFDAVGWEARRASGRVFNLLVILAMLRLPVIYQ